MPEVGLDLITHLLAEAKRNGAEVISTVCPLCQFNLEAFAEQAGNSHQLEIPVLYFTQLLALAFGVPLKEAGFQRSFISIKPVLAEKEIAYA